MPVSWEGLAEFEEAPRGAHELLGGCKAIFGRDGIVHGLAQALDGIDAGMVGGVEEQANAEVMGEPGTGEVAIVDDVVVERDVEARDGMGVSALDGLEQAQKEIGVLGFTLDPGYLSAVCIQGACEVALAFRAPMRGSRSTSASSPILGRKAGAAVLGMDVRSAPRDRKLFFQATALRLLQWL